MSKSKTAPNCFHYRMTHKDKNYAKKDYWQQGEALTEKDLELLKEVKDFYLQNGYAPCRADLSHQSVNQLKSRFRTWKNVMLAAGIPFWNGDENKKIKQERVENEVEG